MARFILVLLDLALMAWLIYRTFLSYRLEKTLAGLDDPRVLLTLRERRKLARSAVMQQETEKLLRGTTL